MSPIVPNGKATRPSGDHAVPDSQRAERYQATDPTFFGPANPPLAWRRALPIFATFTVMCVGLFVPREVALIIAGALGVRALVVLWRLA
jgi:hypothetical protein